MTDFDGHIGKTRETTDNIDTWQARALAATLGLDHDLGEGQPLPLAWHWIYFRELVPLDQVGDDGHPKTGDGFLPDLGLPRRMFAGAELSIERPLRIGDQVLRRETIENISLKEGRSGALGIINLRADYFVESELRLSERRDLIYRPAAEAGTGTTSEPTGLATVPDTPFKLDITPSSVMLFRFSALTFNSHRIHFDLPYAQQEEHYPNLVIHGPLTATLVAQVGSRAGNAPVSKFSFRAQSPLFLGDVVRIRGEKRGDKCEVNAYSPSGGVAMSAKFEY